ncbi:MAG: DUF5989 family protein [Pirellulales bacterium]
MASESERENESLERLAAEKNTGLFGEFVGFLKQTKKWWLAPIVIVMLLIGLLAVAAATGAAPFIYTLF